MGDRGAALRAGALPTSGRRAVLPSEGGAAADRVHDGGLGGGWGGGGGGVVGGLVLQEAALQEGVVRVAVERGGVHRQPSPSLLRQAGR